MKFDTGELIGLAVGLFIAFIGILILANSVWRHSTGKTRRCGISTRFSCSLVVGSLLSVIGAIIASVAGPVSAQHHYQTVQAASQLKQQGWDYSNLEAVEGNVDVAVDNCSFSFNLDDINGRYVVTYGMKNGRGIPLTPMKAKQLCE